MNWLLASLITLIGWGVSGVIFKLASHYFSWTQIFVVSSIVTFAASLTILFFAKPQINVFSPGFGYCILAGIAEAVAAMAFYSAMGCGKAMIVVPLTALYPVITIILSYLVLSEKISLFQGIGIALGILALLLMSLD